MTFHNFIKYLIISCFPTGFRVRRPEAGKTPVSLMGLRTGKVKDWSFIGTFLGKREHCSVRGSDVYNSHRTSLAENLQISGTWDSQAAERLYAPRQHARLSERTRQ